MYTKEDIEKAKQYLDNEGYGTGSNFTLNAVANLMAEYAAKNCSIPAVINCVAVPEWLTDEIRALAKTTWNDHKDFNDNKRVEAMRIIKRCALAAGYTITIKKATELLQQHCL